MAFFVYILRCSDGSLYVGHTDDLDARLHAHRSRRYDGYTAKRQPVELIYSETFVTRDDAFAAEHQLKGWSRAKKLALADGDWAEVRRQALRAGRHNRRPTVLVLFMAREPHHERVVGLTGRWGHMRAPSLPLTLRLSKGVPLA